MTLGIPGLEIPQIIRDKCPTWTSRLENEDAYAALETKGKSDPNIGGGMGTCIENYNCCIAGEANDFKGKYVTAKGNYCTTCRTYADSLYSDLTTLGYAQAHKPKRTYRYHEILHQSLFGNDNNYWRQPQAPRFEYDAHIPDYRSSLEKFQNTLNGYARHLERVHNPKEEVIIPEKYLTKHSPPQEHLRIPIEVIKK